MDSENTQNNTKSAKTLQTMQTLPEEYSTQVQPFIIEEEHTLQSSINFANSLDDSIGEIPKGLYVTQEHVDKLKKIKK